MDVPAARCGSSTSVRTASTSSPACRSSCPRRGLSVDRLRTFRIPARRGRRAGGAAALDRRPAGRSAHLGSAQRATAIAFRLDLVVRPARVPATGGGHSVRQRSGTTRPGRGRGDRHQPGRIRRIRPRAGQRASARLLGARLLRPSAGTAGPRARQPQRRATAAGQRRPDAAHGQPHGRQLPRPAAAADARPGRAAGTAVPPARHFADWRLLLELRNGLHLLEDTCEDQRAAITEWIDALDEWPVDDDAADAPRTRTAEAALARRARARRTGPRPMCVASRGRPRPRCRCTSRRRAIAPTTSCAR